MNLIQVEDIVLLIDFQNSNDFPNHFDYLKFLTHHSLQ